MSTRRHHSTRAVIRCRGAKCNADADVVVAFENRDAQPYCHPCANAVRYSTDTPYAVEYPLETYYSSAGDHVSQFNPYEKPLFTLFDPDNEDAFLCADNRESPESSVHPHDYC